MRPLTKKEQTLLSAGKAGVSDKEYIFLEHLQETNDLLQKIADKNTLKIDNISEAKADLSPLENNFISSMKEVQTSVEAVKQAIQDIKPTSSLDTSGIEKLLSRIADKKPESIDLKELSNISAILNEVLFAVQTTASTTEVETKEVLKPDLQRIQNILNTLNDNLVSFSIPNFDYKRLEGIIKRNLNISVSGGGGGISKHILNKAETIINPATEDTLSKLVGMAITQYDYVSQTQNATQDIWTFKTGGAGGTTVATITITYTDATKMIISTVIKT